MLRKRQYESELSKQNSGSTIKESRPPGALDLPGDGPDYAAIAFCEHDVDVPLDDHDPDPDHGQDQDQDHNLDLDPGRKHDGVEARGAPWMVMHGAARARKGGNMTSALGLFDGPLIGRECVV